MAKLTPVYQVVVKNKAGTQVAIIDDYRSLQFQKVVNDIGFFTIMLSANDPKCALFERDGQVEIKRKIPGLTDWYIEYECVILDFTTMIFQNGNTQFTVVGCGYNEILKRRIIAFRKDTVRAKKNDRAETVIKEYVLENCGTAATTANGRFYAGVIPGFTVEADGANGNIWGGERSGKNLLETIQKIAQITAIDYAVVGTGAGTYEFRTYTHQLGIDRTTIGLDTTTGLNAAGNPPHIFSVNAGNIQELVFSEKTKDTSNLVYMYGQGDAALQLIEYAEDLTDIGLSPFGQRELMRGGGSQATSPELQYLANELLEELLPRNVIVFKPLDSVASLYGINFFVGDRVTINYNGTDYNKRIMSVRVNVSGGEGNAGETSKEFTFADI